MEASIKLPATPGFVPAFWMLPLDNLYGWWPFNQPFYIILNLAVGGGWVGTPDESTAFPAIMEVDYVRVSPNYLKNMGFEKGVKHWQSATGYPIKAQHRTRSVLQ